MSYAPSRIWNGQLLTIGSCASYFNSPKYFNQQTRMHHLLLNAKVFICDKMWTELAIRQYDGNIIRVRSDRAIMKIEEHEDAIHVFVPGDAKGLSSCYCTELPEQLALTLGIEDLAAAKKIYRLLNDQAMSLEAIMRDEDLPGYSWIEKPPPQHPVQLPIPNGTHEVGSDADASGRVAGEEPALDIVVTRGADTREPIPLPPLPLPPLPLPPSPQSAIEQVPVWQQAARGQEYKKLLQEVVRQARRIQPSQGELSLAEIDQVLDELDNEPNYLRFQSSFGGRGSWNFEENARIGAAGELFVSQ
jgi:hypothetical protein